jgi:hypothetical protein
MAVIATPPLRCCGCTRDSFERSFEPLACGAAKSVGEHVRESGFSCR